MQPGEGKSPCDQAGPFSLSSQLLGEPNSLTLKLLAANSGTTPPSLHKPPYSTASPLCTHTPLPTHTLTHLHPELGRSGGVEDAEGRGGGGVPCLHHH